MSRVVYDSATKRFGEVEALAALSLEIADGEFLVLLGPSGSGKTTALRLLAGLEALTDGHIWIGDTLVDTLPPRSRDIAMVFQDYALYPQMTVFANLAFGLRTRRIPRSEVRRRVQDAAEYLGLADLLQRKPRQLSGGQRQRVAVGRCLVREPQVFLMDEPLSNLDAKLRAHMRSEITSLQRRVGTTTVYVTHDQVEAMTMGDRVAVLSEGRLEQVSDPATIYEQPANLFVAGFIGSPSMSLITVSAAPNGRCVRVTRGNIGIDIPTNSPPVPSAVVLGIRPEDARLWTEGAGLAGPIEGQIDYVELLGRETIIGVVLSDDVTLVACHEGQLRATPGETIRLGLRCGRLYLFDLESGGALGRL